MSNPSDPPSEGGANSRALIASILSVFLISIAATAYVAHRSSRFEPIREAVRIRMAGFRFSRGLDPDLIARIPVVKYHHDGATAAAPKDPSEVPTHRHRETISRGGSAARGVTTTTPSSFWSQVHKTLSRIVSGKSGGKDGSSAAREVPSSCSICTEDFVEGDELRRLTCGHLFHMPCIDPWLQDRARTCPLW
ncbi:hypothetical protein JDV02_010362 [Purpureocillium takamizusanense]|uniref:RING-type domain-containing protein n=1 Tax=Purpureocillium takamizusanense TaxID=2060973 RepID=A0A9Q8QQJ0_9HYPO|nr:uncharacterized protein JDV02_010362 [Purpureocillium takamizusanense]UNI24628.1 hypothetical protein JDV02_010362 [Purpureocillium takamizusanense]